jgi:hypothetical protein
MVVHSSIEVANMTRVKGLTHLLIFCQALLWLGELVARGLLRHSIFGLVGRHRDGLYGVGDSDVGVDLDFDNPGESDAICEVRLPAEYRGIWSNVCKVVKRVGRRRNGQSNGVVVW